MSEKINTLMVNGKWFRDEGSIDPQVLMSLRRLKRFNIFHTHTEKLSVLEHSVMGALLVPKYCDYMALNLEDGKYEETYNNLSFRYFLTQAFLTHDLEEIIVSDIPAPVKLEGLEEVKSEIREIFRRYLKVPFATKDVNVVLQGVIHLDMICAFLECVEYKFTFEEMMKYYVQKIIDSKLEGFIFELGGECVRIFKIYKEGI